MRAGALFRLTRAVVFAAVCVVVSGLGHALQSGTPLPLPALAPAFVAMSGVGWWLAARERGVLLVAGVSAAGQVVMHGLFSRLHPCLSPHGVPGANGPSGKGRSTAGPVHSHHGSAGEASMDLAGLPASLMVPDVPALTSGMAAAHVVAGLLCGWWLWRGEAAIRQLGRSLALFVRAPLRLAWSLLSRTGHHLPRPLSRAPRRPSRRPSRLVVLHGISRRGPPLGPLPG
ncbi:hypothetical protein [Streptomyces sp. AK02-01A]|uniref:hypothetical protein n=1 Tax=Streptomyces sp. AK02-01A TaxID=3028648 RepID=UPI0029B852EC|nr:hypothetical protein [Streptomyces sp. AK02-01A]MDX3853489.1 hypothetical protein [Streptomyces sp. AK02-01A]